MQKVSQLQQIKSLYVIQRYKVTNLWNNFIIVRNRIPNIYFLNAVLKNSYNSIFKPIIFFATLICVLS